MLSDRATDPEFARDTDLFHTRIYCSPLLGLRGLWPATDPFHSASVVEVSARHAELAHAARRPIANEAGRIAALAAAERDVVEPARRLETFLTTPFFVAEDFTGVTGEFVPLSETLRGVEAILAGDCDDVPIADLRFIGTLPSTA
jgi:F-type H+-transporting ATPase subunit beta